MMLKYYTVYVGQLPTSLCFWWLSQKRLLFRLLLDTDPLPPSSWVDDGKSFSPHVEAPCSCPLCCPVTVVIRASSIRPNLSFNLYNHKYKIPKRYQRHLHHLETEAKTKPRVITPTCPVHLHSNSTLSHKVLREVK